MMKTFWHWLGLVALGLVSTNAAAQTYYVSDITKNVIEGFSANGTDLGAWASSGLKEPQGMVFDAQGNLYVVNSQVGEVEKFSPTGQDLGVFASTGLNQPVAIVTDSQGNFYVSNVGNQTVERFSPEGQDLGVFVHTDWLPWGLAFDRSGNLYVGSQGDSTVQRFSPTGASLGYFVSSNISMPNGLAFDGWGNFYVANVGTHSVEKFTANGVDLGRFANLSTNVDGLFFDAEGNLYVCCAGANKVEEFSPSGADLGAFATGGGPVFMAQAPAPNLITQQPVSTGVVIGGTANLSVTVNGTVLSYQWQKDGANLADAGNISGTQTGNLEIQGLGPADAGMYRVVVTTANGSYASEPAALGVLAPPTTDGVFLITFYDRNEVEEFSATGVDLGSYATTGMNGPVGLALDAQGNLYVANNRISTVEKYSPTGADLGVWAAQGTSNPTALVLDSVGNLYAATTTARLGEEFTPEGREMGGFGGTGSASWGVALDGSRNVYLSDQNADVVQRFGSNGSSLGVFASANLSTPAGVVFDSGGNLYVANQGTGTVEKFSSTGADLGVFASGLVQPTGLYLDRFGNLYVCCPTKNLVEKFSSAGVDQGVFATTGSNQPMGIIERPPVIAVQAQPQNQSSFAGQTTVISVGAAGTGLNYQWIKDGVALANGGRIAGADSANLTISATVLSDAGNYWVTITNGGSPVASASAQLTVFAAPTTGPVFIVSEINNSTLEEYGPDGTNLGLFAETGMSQPQGMALDAQGNLYVTNTPLNTVERFSPTGQDLGVFASTGLAWPTAIVADSSGNFYVSNYQSSSIEKFSANGTDLGMFANTYEPPWGLAFDGAGNLLVSMISSNEVIRFSPSGVLLGQFAMGNVSAPAGIAFDGSGNFYVANQGTGTVQKYAADGTSLGTFASGLNAPAGIFFDQAGNLYVCCPNVGLVEKYSPAGVDLGPFIQGDKGGPVFILGRPATISIQGQPAGLTRFYGQAANFTVAATGSNLTYQWYKDGVALQDGANITGSTSPTLMLGAVSGASAGNYNAGVSNAAGPVASLQAALVVVATPTTSPVVLVSYSNTNRIEVFSNGTDLGIFPVSGLNSPAGLAVDGQGSVYVVNTGSDTLDKFSATGELLYSKPTGQSPIGLARDSAGNLYVANNGDDTIERYTANGVDTGVFAHTQAGPWAVVLNNSGQVYVSDNRGSQSSSGSGGEGGGGGGGGVTVGEGGTLTIDGSGSTLTFTSGTVLSGGAVQTNSAGGSSGNDTGGDVVEEFSSSGTVLRTYTSGNLSQPAGLAVDSQGNVYAANQGSNSVEKFSPNGADLGKAPLSGMTVPTGLLLGSNGTFYVAGNAVNEIRLVSQKTGMDAGVYALTGAGTPVLMAARSGVANISQQPVSISLAGGRTATFTARATGAGLVYQWQKNGVNLTNSGHVSGANTASLRIQGVTAADAGQYQLVINSAGGPVATVEVTLTVQGVPVFVQEPATTTVGAGSNFMLTAKATGAIPLSYQWYKNGIKLKNSGTRIMGATSAQLVVKKTGAGDAGTYTVTASNPAGSTTSGAAMVTVQ
jgi:sugar lactone lactonase YvrE